MRTATPFVFVTLVACGLAETQLEGDLDAPVAERGALRDPFERVAPEHLAPKFDRAHLECDGAGWLVTAEIAGRADSVRAVIVRTEGRKAAWDLELASEPFVEGALWQPFRRLLEDPAAECDTFTSAVVVEARDAGGATVDCVAFGAGAADLVAGKLDGRMASVRRGDWGDCRVRESR